MVYGGNVQEMFIGMKDVVDIYKFDEVNLEVWMVENVEGFEGLLMVK